MDDKENKESKKGIPFAEVPGNAIKETFGKERKYDSFVDEYRRVNQHGHSVKVKYTKGIKSLFTELIDYSFKGTGFDYNEDSFFDGSIIEMKKVGKKLTKKQQSPNARIKVIKYEMKKNKCLLTFQSMTKHGEIRTTLEVTNPAFGKPGQKAVVTFSQLFKREITYYGMQDAFRKRLMQRQVNYRMAKMCEHMVELGYLKEVPYWAQRSLKKAEKLGHISVA